ncbi:hypothetical v-bcl2 [Porcine lymphotropic herpesvirus 3]|uniref:Hypothetical v-bcl2 n=2 Tax=Macavirus suidgamma5 TaxID=3050359 RepID=Q772V2_9GAMA|nr:hypothetical v-bcl2 [Porcine lymphotropic herpesvirus 3]AAO12297.1 hypothetical v-bcl2 [Porcine lymphotropic herpesvirus 3]AAO12311.1 hypothetical v-bcl2 [Porcine lymphotropic herpesvirus 3]
MKMMCALHHLWVWFCFKLALNTVPFSELPSKCTSPSPRTTMSGNGERNLREPSMEQVRGLFRELSKTSDIINNILWAVLNPQLNHPLTVSEALLTWLVKQCIKENFASLVKCLIELPYHNADEHLKIQWLQDLVKLSYRDNEDSFEKFCATLAMASMYIMFVLENRAEFVSLVSHVLGSFYLRHRMAWMVRIQGFSTGARKKYPGLWLSTRLKMLYKVN